MDFFFKNILNIYILFIFNKKIGYLIFLIRTVNNLEKKLKKHFYLINLFYIQIFNIYKIFQNFIINKNFNIIKVFLKFYILLYKKFNNNKYFFIINFIIQFYKLYYFIKKSN